MQEAALFPPTTITQKVYRHGLLNEPAAILSMDLSVDLLHFITDFYCLVSTIEKIEEVIPAGLLKVCRFY